MHALLLVSALLGADPTAPGLVDRALARAALDAGRPLDAKAWVPALVVPAPPPAVAPAGDEELTKGEALLKASDGPGALRAFRRALAKAPSSAAALWGLSRAADLMGDRALARHAAARVVGGNGGDRTQALVEAARWRLEQPE